MDAWMDKFIWNSVFSSHDVSSFDLLLSDDWLHFLDLSPFLAKRLHDILQEIMRMRKTKIIFPPQDNIMSWSYYCRPSDIKVIILGQDPYHGGQATGLAFSVHKDCQVPPSLKNIFTELANTQENFKLPTHGCLAYWARQGVLLLNTVLTVEKGQAGSHAKIGWGWFTDLIISSVSEKLDNCVFLLWGSKAVEKSVLINPQRHLILKSQHPSPLATINNRSSKLPKFLGCGHFQQANKYLILHGRGTIDWSL
ncbi:uracil-DNA glycosylase [Marmot herpesvirus 1]|nr:uracil-DNA glycosylase [Marmot herpesvirus 1]